MQPRKGKCPHCGARLDWGAPAPAGAARRSRIVIAVVVVGVGVAAAVAWTTWSGSDARSSAPPAPAPAVKAAACESLVKRLMSGAALSRSEIETFRSVCGTPAPSR